MTNRAIPSPSKVYSRSRNIRLRAGEDAALKQMAAPPGQTPSQFIRQLIRIAATGGPDYFKDGEKEIRLMHVHLAAVGRNLNQLVRAVNRGHASDQAELLSILNTLGLLAHSAEEFYRAEVRKTVKKVRAAGAAAQPH